MFGRGRGKGVRGQVALLAEGLAVLPAARPRREAEATARRNARGVPLGQGAASRSPLGPMRVEPVGTPLQPGALGRGSGP